MAKMIQVRHVSDRLHRELTRRAKARGQTLTSYVQEILEREIERPPADEVFKRIARRSSVDLGIPAADLIREERQRRKAS
jgi:antitoxin FitA